MSSEMIPAGEFDMIPARMSADILPFPSLYDKFQQVRAERSDAVLYRLEAADYAPILNIRDNYRAQTRNLVSFLKEHGHRLNEAGLSAYFEYLENHPGPNGKPLKPATIRSRRQAAKNRIKKVFREETPDLRILVDEVLKKVDELSPPPGTVDTVITRDKYLNAEEVAALVTAAEETSVRNGLFIRLLWATGCRINEITTLTGDRIQIGKTSVKLTVRGKGNKLQKYKERDVYISRALYDRVLCEFHGSDPSGRFSVALGNAPLLITGGLKPFRNNYISDRIRKAGDVTGKRVSAHTLRHSFATDVIDKQGDDSLDKLSKYLGHADIKITSVYLHRELDVDYLTAREV